ncbi:MAG: hypothetical protein AB8H79_23630 [Myxococcota bacterium]
MERRSAYPVLAVLLSQLDGDDGAVVAGSPGEAIGEWVCDQGAPGLALIACLRELVALLDEAGVLATMKAADLRVGVVVGMLG